MFASSAARKVTSPLRKFICFHAYIWTCTFIYNSNLWHYKSKMQCFICQVCLASDVFLLFESSVPWAYSMLDGSSADTSCSFRWMSFVSISQPLGMVSFLIKTQIFNRIYIKKQRQLLCVWWINYSWENENFFAFVKRNIKKQEVR